MTRLTLAVRLFLAALPPVTRRAWGWDLTTGILAGCYQGCVWTFVLRIARADLGATDRQMAFIMVAPAAGYIFATVWARQMEGRAKLPFVYWTWMVARGAFLLTPLLSSREQFVALVCLTPLIFSVSTPAYTAVMKDIYPDAVRGRCMSIVRVAAQGVALAVALLAGRVLDAGVGFRAMFFVGGVFGVLSAWSFSRVPVSETQPSTEPRVSTFAFLRDTVGILGRNAGYRWFCASVFVYGFGNLVASTIYPIYLVDRFHVSNTQVANLQNIGALVTIAGFFVWGSFLDRRGPLLTVLLCVAIVCIQPVCYALAGNMTLIYVAAAAGGLAMSGIDIGYLNTTLLFAEPGRAAQYQALHSSLFGIRGTIAPFCAIPLMQAIGPRSAFWLALAIMVAGVALQVLSNLHYRRSTTARAMRPV